jgi:hypothetical protein
MWTPRNKKVHCPPDTPAVSRFIKRSADEHALQNGPGRVAKERNKIIRNRADSADVDFLLSIIFRHVDMHAYGLVEVPLNRLGGYTQLPKMTSSKTKLELEKLYKDAVKASDGQFGMLSDTKVPIRSLYYSS